MSDIVDQPAPEVNRHPAIQDLVIADMQERKRLGLERYGTLLQPFNGRKALVDRYQELLDAVQYTRQEIEERAFVDAVVDAARRWHSAKRFATEEPEEANRALMVAVDVLLEAEAGR